MKYEKLETETLQIPCNAFVSVKEMGNITEITYNSNLNSKPQTIKLNADEYYVIRTGEIKNYQKKSENRSQSADSMRKTLNRIKELIQTNVTDTKKVRWCTLTYADNMQDTQQLYQDFRKFNQRFQRYLTKRKLEKAEYISVIEPQGRGAWHCHVLYIFSHTAPYIPNEDFSKMWGHGFTKVTKLNDVSNVAVYLMAYLSDIEIPLENKELFNKNEIKEITIDNEKKAFIKGRRLVLYPSGINIIRHSKGIKYPKTKRMKLEQAKNLVKNKSKTYHTAYRLSNEKGYSTLVDKTEYRLLTKEGI